MYLMYQDEKIAYFDLEEFNIVVLNHNLMPYALKGINFNLVSQKNIFKNVHAFMEYLGSRVLSLSRKNAKKLFALFQLPQNNDLSTRVNICIKCRGVSVQDSYWIRLNDNEKWANYNIRQNKLREIIDISLYGSYPSISVNPVCPELTTKGLFPKGWVRQGNKLYLLKTDTTNFVNTKMEVLSSKILSCFNINYVEYTGRMRTTSIGRFYVDKCENFITEDISFVEAYEVNEYCRRLGINFEEECLKKFGDDFANIAVIDFILSNTDRHMQNYGFLQNNFGDLISVAPLFDFNNALVADYFDRNASITLSQMFNRNESIFDCMQRYLPYSSLKFDYARFKKLRSSNRQYKAVFDRVLERIKIVGLI